MVRQQEPVVTGDAVVLDVQIAQLPVRALSAMIDVIVVFIAYTIGVLLWATTLTQFDTALSAAVLIIFTVLSLVGYPIAFETATRGRNPERLWPVSTSNRRPAAVPTPRACTPTPDVRNPLDMPQFAFLTPQLMGVA